MSNLLPLETKNSIKKEYHLRVVATVLFLLGAILLVSVAWLAPVYILSVNKYDVTQSELVVVQAEISNKQPDNPRETINDINSKLEILKGDDFTKHYAYDIVKDIVEQKNKEIEIESIIYDKSTTDIKVLLRGNALSRESLSSFVSNLEKNELYSRVDLPISNFVKETDLDFSLTIYIEYDKSEENNDEQ